MLDCELAWKAASVRIHKSELALSGRLMHQQANVMLRACASPVVLDRKALSDAIHQRYILYQLPHG